MSKRSSRGARRRITEKKSAGLPGNMTAERGRSRASPTQELETEEKPPLQSAQAQEAQTESPSAREAPQSTLTQPAEAAEETQNRETLTVEQNDVAEAAERPPEFQGQLDLWSMSESETLPVDGLPPPDEDEEAWLRELRLNLQIGSAEEPQEEIPPETVHTQKRSGMRLVSRPSVKSREKSPAETGTKAHPETEETQKPGTVRKKRKHMSPVLRFVIKLALVAGILSVTFAWVLGIHICHGNRMHPFLLDGDLLVTYKLDSVYRVGDAVAYRVPETEETRISRIAAMGPCEIQLTRVGEFLVDGIIPDENVFYATRELEDSEIIFPYRLEEGEYFLLDDYRTIGNDSRIFGAVTSENLEGKIVYVFRRRGI